MLAITRMKGEVAVIGADEIRITILDFGKTQISPNVWQNNVRIKIEDRQSLYDYEATLRAKDEIKLRNEVTLFIVRIKTKSVRFGIRAPERIPVNRLEIYEEIMRASNQKGRSVA